MNTVDTNLSLYITRGPLPIDAPHFAVRNRVGSIQSEPLSHCREHGCKCFGGANHVVMPIAAASEYCFGVANTGDGTTLTKEMFVFCLSG